MSIHFVKASSGAWRFVDDSGNAVDAPNRFLRALELRGLSWHTVRAYGFDLVTVHRWLDEIKKSVADLTSADLIEFIAFEKKHNASPNTINRRLIALRLFYRFFCDKELPSGPGGMTPSPHYIGRYYDPHLGIIRIRKGDRLKLRVKVPRTLVEPLTKNQVDNFLGEFSRYRDIAIVMLMLLCGLRSCEVLSLTTADINFPDGQLRIHGKGNKERLMPLPELLVPVLKKYFKLERPREVKSRRVFVVLQGKCAGQPMTPAGLRSLFRSRRKVQGLGNANPHRLRHTFGAEMARAGVRLPVLQRMMGHATGLITLQYICLSTADIAEEYDRAMEQIRKRYENLKG